ncbi:MAG: LysM peptidoglycan-binding domain-containing protein, partial [Prosthecobacter sp.]
MKFLPALALLLSIANLQAAESHVVAKGDTLSSIARRHGCTVASLKGVNALKSDLIRVGQTLKVPAEKVPAPASLPSVPPAAQPTPPVIPAPKPSPTLADSLKKLTEADRWKVQLYLDHVLFTPGKVDGLTGEFTVKAAERWMAAAPKRSLGSLLAAARGKFEHTQVPFTIPADAAGFIGVMPATLEEKAAAKTLLYETLAEYAAERFHTDLSTLRRLNPEVDLTLLKAGDTLQVPATAAFAIETWPPKGVSTRAAPAGVHLRIQHDERMIEVVNADGTRRAAFPITVGTKPEHVREGAWHIKSVTANPSFWWDDVMLKEGRKGPKQHLLPPGPNNPVGVLWMDLEPDTGPEAHIGIHGTADPGHIGRNHSSGCIRLANSDIVRLARLVGKGTRVTW